ncbi:DUF1003 domain-containing protein [Candidatus Peregrinibacteria bacterium]|nr:DUF1003 domain-containing protein [Candidatus Peregrinibacteria bacterium]
MGTCALCGQQKPVKQLMPVELVRDLLIQFIRKSNPEWDGTGMICQEDLSRFRSAYMEELLIKQHRDISALDRRVLKSLKEQEIISENINQAFDRQLTFGEKIADKVAEFGGSWKFILIFGGVLAFWIALNSWVLIARPFDPYPFILLNLVLSTLAAIQAPVIMMSQNRQEDRDRLRSEEDYRVNLKAELEVRHLNEKLDHFLGRQWQRLLEIQQIQLDLMEEVAAKKAGISKPPAAVPAPATSSAPPVTEPPKS